MDVCSLRFGLRGSLLAIAVLAGLPAPAHAQAASQAATVSALLRYPGFYTDRAVVVRGRLTVAGPALSLQDGAGHRVPAAWRDATRPDDVVDAIGMLWDLGRMAKDDPRLAGYDVSPWLAAGGEWPRPGDAYVFGIAHAHPAQTSTSDNLRAIVLDGTAAAGRKVTVIGQFRGRNLFGDLPRSPGASRWDFVVAASGSAIWVSGMAPRGKDFDLDVDAKADTGEWLRVTGTVREGNGLMWIEATALAHTTPSPELEAVPAPAAVVVPFPPPQILFSAPAAGEIDVPPDTTVRIQVSRDIDPQTLRGRVQALYVNVPADTPGPTFSVDVRDGGRVLSLKFAQPLERSRTVRIEILDGIKGTDGQALKPWSLTFKVGG